MRLRLEQPPEDVAEDCAIEGLQVRVFWTQSTTFAGDLLTRLEAGLQGEEITARGTYFLRVDEGAAEERERCQFLAFEIRRPVEATPTPSRPQPSPAVDLSETPGQG